MKLLRNLKNRKYVTLDCIIENNFEVKLEIFKGLIPKIKEIQNLLGVHDFRQFGNTLKHNESSLRFFVSKELFELEYTNDGRIIHIEIKNNRLYKFACPTNLLQSASFMLSEMLDVVEQYCSAVGKKANELPNIKEDVDAFKQLIQKEN